MELLAAELAELPNKAELLASLHGAGRDDQGRKIA
jgi:hypothetical protein